MNDQFSTLLLFHPNLIFFKYSLKFLEQILIVVLGIYVFFKWNSCTLLVLIVTFIIWLIRSHFIFIRVLFTQLMKRRTLKKLFAGGATAFLLNFLSHVEIVFYISFVHRVIFFFKSSVYHWFCKGFMRFYIYYWLLRKITHIFIVIMVLKSCQIFNEFSISILIRLILFKSDLSSFKLACLTF